MAQQQQQQQPQPQQMPDQQQQLAQMRQQAQQMRRRNRRGGGGGIGGGGGDGGEIGGLSPAAVAILEFATDIEDIQHKKTPIGYITSKRSFYWAALCSMIAARVKEDGYPISDIDLISRIYNAVSAYAVTLADDHEEIPDPDTLPHPGLPFAHFGGIVESAVMEYLIRSLIFESHTDDVSALFRQLANITRDAYNELVARKLITDPVIETAIGVAILGLVPFKIVKKTKKGKATYTRIRAALYDYAFEKRASSTSFNINLEVARIAKTFKEALVAAYDAVLKEYGSEPDYEPDEQHDDDDAAI